MARKSIGRKKYGKARFQKLAAAGRLRHGSSYYGPLPYPSRLENVHGSEPKDPFKNA